MRVLMPARFLRGHVGGNSTYTQNLARALPQQDITVDTFGHGRGGARAYLSEAGAALRPRRDLLHFAGDTGVGFAPRAPSIVTVHGVASRWISTARTPAQERIWRWRVASAIAAADAVVTVSPTSAADIAEVFSVDLEDITVIAHGLDHIVPGTGSAEPVTVRGSSELPEGVPAEFVLYLGNIEPRKNLIALVEAFGRDEVRALGIPLVIAGAAAWNADESMRAIRATPGVIALGRVSDAEREALMRQAALFVFPSLYEGFGFPILEAMALGCPVLTSNRGSLRDLAGPSRVLADVTADAIADGLVSALRDGSDAERMRVEGPVWARRFTWDESARAHADIYRKVVGA